jgi:hypothetical protein
MNDAHDAEPEESPYVRLPWGLVAAGLGGVLLLALGFGLYANRYLRPQLQLVPTPIAVAAATPAPPPTLAATPAPTPLVVATAVAPTATTPPATAPPATPQPTPPAASPTTVATPRATVSPELATEIGDAYETYWQVRAKALYDLDPSSLSEVMAGDHLAAAEELIAQLRTEGRAIQTDVTHNYAIIRATSDEAEIADEYTDESIYVDINSHQSLTQPLAVLVKEQYQMNKIDGTWRVVSLVRAP